MGASVCLQPEGWTSAMPHRHCPLYCLGYKEGMCQAKGDPCIQFQEAHDMADLGRGTPASFTVSMVASPEEARLRCDDNPGGMNPELTLQGWPSLLMN